MTYCVGLLLNDGIVLLSDTRTNAGLDNISTYRKMFLFEEPGEKVIAIMTAGSLSVTQTTLARLRAEIDEKMSAMQGVTASMIVAGQRKGGAMRLFLIYPEGNFIEATEDTPFLQIGEHKYGKPILDRVVKPQTSLQDAQKAVLLSMDSTLRSNLSVGMPLDLCVIERDACKVTLTRRIEAGDEQFRAMSEAWSRALRDGFSRISL